MKLLLKEKIVKGITNSGGYPNEDIRQQVRDIEMIKTDLDMNSESDGDIALEWDTLEMFTEDQLLKR